MNCAVSKSMTPRTRTSEAVTVTPEKPTCLPQSSAQGAAPGVRRQLPPKGEAGMGGGRRLDVSEARDVTETPTRAIPRPVAGESQCQDTCKSVQQRGRKLHDKGCSVRACVRVCVCVCVQACESAHRIAVPYTSWPPYSVQGLSAAIRQAHVWPQPRACFPLHPNPRLGAEAQADEATQTRPLCAGSGGSITRGLYPSSAPPPPGRTAWELLFTLG